MQSAKDSFYVALRDRLSLVNPGRTTVVRGAIRPAVLVLENELPGETGTPDVFMLEWGAVAVDTATDTAVNASGALPLCSMRCTLQYATRGTQESLGMDRGRVLNDMDGELRKMLHPPSAARRDFTADPAIAMATNIFWSAAEYGPAVLKDDRLTRAVTLTVFAMQEAGEQ